MITALATAVILLAAPLVVGAQQPPLAFKDIELGKPVPESPLGGKLNCRWRPNICLYSIKQYPRTEDQVTIAGKAIEGMTVDLIEGVVHSIYIFFPESGFADAKAAFAEKYKSMKCRTQQVQNSFGATLNDESCVYENSLGAMLLGQRSTSTIMSGLSIRTHEWQKRRNKEQADAKKDI